MQFQRVGDIDDDEDEEDVSAVRRWEDVRRMKAERFLPFRRTQLSTMEEPIEEAYRHGCLNFGNRSKSPFKQVLSCSMGESLVDQQPVQLRLQGVHLKDRGTWQIQYRVVGGRCGELKSVNWRCVCEAELEREELAHLCNYHFRTMFPIRMGQKWQNTPLEAIVASTQRVRR